MSNCIIIQYQSTHWRYDGTIKIYTYKYMCTTYSYSVQHARSFVLSSHAIAGNVKIKLCTHMKMEMIKFQMRIELRNVRRSCIRTSIVHAYR